VDTVIATLLDPRTKDLEGIPQAELNEAKDLLQKEFIQLCKNSKELDLVEGLLFLSASKDHSLNFGSI
jgi:hypothetical protein